MPPNADVLYACSAVPEDEDDAACLDCGRPILDCLDAGCEPLVAEAQRAIHSESDAT